MAAETKIMRTEYSNRPTCRSVNVLRVKKAILACLLFLVTPALKAQTWSTLPVDIAMPMNTSTPGTALSPSIADAGTVSSTCVVGTSCYWSSTPSGMQVGANQNACTNLGPVSLNNSSTTYPARSLNYNNIAHSDIDNGIIGYFSFSSAIRSTHARVSACITIGTPKQANGNDWDMLFIQALSGNYALLQLAQSCPSSGVYGVRIEYDGGVHSPLCIDLTPQQTYFFALDYNLATGWEDLWVYTPQGTLMGQTSVRNTNTGNVLANLRLPSNENGSDNGTTYYQNVLVEWSNPFPTGTAIFTNGSATVSGSGFPSDGSWNNAFMNVGNASYTILSATATTVTLGSAFSGSTGNNSYEVDTPLFWASSSSPTVQPPTGLTAIIH